jgi:nitrate reductase NapE component
MSPDRSSRCIETIDAFQKESIFRLPTTLGVESVRRMETFLNLAWGCLAIVSVCLWMRFELRTGAQRRLPLIALIMLLVILFPVISVSDDLWSIQNPAETDTCQRRNQIAPSLHPLFPVLAAPPAPIFAEIHLDVSYFSASVGIRTEAYQSPALEGIENRPPPTA